MLNNHYIRGNVGVGIISSTPAIHLPTVVTNSKGKTVIRGYHELSLGAKLEVEISQDFLLDTVTTENPLQLDTMCYVLSPPDISRHTKACKQVAHANWLLTRAPIITAIVGNVDLHAVTIDDDSFLAMA